MSSVIFAANRGFALERSRAGLLQRWRHAGYQTVIATADDAYAQRLEASGSILETVNFDRGGLSPRNDLSALGRMHKLIAKYDPCLIHLFNAKPLLFGCLAAGGRSRCKIVSTITGLGHAFIKGRLTRRAAQLGYQWLLKRSDVVIFQNNDDMALFLEHRWVRPDRARLVLGSGVDVTAFQPLYRLSERKIIRVGMVARALRSKGVLEFLEAAGRLQKKYAKVEFVFGGELDPHNPDAIPPPDLDAALARTGVEFVGYVDDMPRFLQSLDIYVLPSYREGMPRTVLEASASGLPVVATDAPGLRQAVDHGVTGLLVPVRDADAVADAMESLIEDPVLRRQMGAAGRRKAEGEFDIQAVEKTYVDIYRALGIDI